MRSTYLDFALIVIKNECNSHERCIDCPLKNKDGACYIAYSHKIPSSWELKSDDKQISDSLFK